MLRYTTHISVLCILLTSANCTQESDVGTACHPTDASQIISSNILLGENASATKNQLIRDTGCHSTYCIEHGGMQAYCSQQCSIEVSTTTCTESNFVTTCGAGKTCYDGKCAKDACPTGFWCRPLQKVGPLATSGYCQRLEACVRDIDCGDATAFQCETIVCPGKNQISATSTDSTVDCQLVKSEKLNCIVQPEACPVPTDVACRPIASSDIVCLTKRNVCLPKNSTEP